MEPSDIVSRPPDKDDAGATEKTACPRPILLPVVSGSEEPPQERIDPPALRPLTLVRSPSPSLISFTTPANPVEQSRWASDSKEKQNEREKNVEESVGILDVMRMAPLSRRPTPPPQPSPPLQCIRIPSPTTNVSQPCPPALSPVAIRPTPSQSVPWWHSRYLQHQRVEQEEEQEQEREQEATLLVHNDSIGPAGDEHTKKSSSTGPTTTNDATTARKETERAEGEEEQQQQQQLPPQPPQEGKGGPPMWTRTSLGGQSVYWTPQISPQPGSGQRTTLPARDGEEGVQARCSSHSTAAVADTSRQEVPGEAPPPFCLPPPDSSLFFPQRAARSRAVVGGPPPARTGDSHPLPFPLPQSQSSELLAMSQMVIIDEEEREHGEPCQRGLDEVAVVSGGVVGGGGDDEAQRIRGPATSITLVSPPPSIQQQKEANPAHHPHVHHASHPSAHQEQSNRTAQMAVSYTIQELQQMSQLVIVPGVTESTSSSCDNHNEERVDTDGDDAVPPHCSSLSMAESHIPQQGQEGGVDDVGPSEASHEQREKQLLGPSRADAPALMAIPVPLSFFSSAVEEAQGEGEEPVMLSNRQVKTAPNISAAVRRIREEGEEGQGGNPSRDVVVEVVGVGEKEEEEEEEEEETDDDDDDKEERPKEREGGSSCPSVRHETHAGGSEEQPGAHTTRVPTKTRTTTKGGEFHVPGRRAVRGIATTTVDEENRGGGEEQQQPRGGTAAPPSRKTKTTTTKIAAEPFIPCRHAALPTRYRNTAGYCCSYCCFTICYRCYAQYIWPTLPASLTGASTVTSDSRLRPRREDPMQRRMSKKDVAAVTSTPSPTVALFDAVSEALQGGAASTTANMVGSSPRTPGQPLLLPSPSASPRVALENTHPRHRTSGSAALHHHDHQHHQPQQREERSSDDGSSSCSSSLSSSDILTDGELRGEEKNMEGDTGTTALNHTSDQTEDGSPLRRGQRRHHSRRAVGVGSAAPTASIAVVPPHPPQSCGICHRGHLVYAAAMLHEWSCEAENFVQRRSASGSSAAAAAIRMQLYENQAVQRYYFIKGQRERRMASTERLRGAFHGSTPCPLFSPGEKSLQRLRHRIASLLASPMREKWGRKRKRGARGAAATTGTDMEEDVEEGYTENDKDSIQRHGAEGEESLRRKKRRRVEPTATPPFQGLEGLSLRGPAPESQPAATAAATTVPVGGIQQRRTLLRIQQRRLERQASSGLSPLPSHRTTRWMPSPGQRPSCEEGGSFYFSVFNPRLETACVWCAVNTLGGREEHDAFFHSSTTGSNPSNAAAAVSAAGLDGNHTIVPLFSFLCPPSLPGVPPRAFKVHVPYLSYIGGASACLGTQMQSLALYVKSDLYRKAVTSLQPASSAGGRGGGGLRLVKETPTGLHMQPILVVRILHHVATTRHPVLPQWVPRRAIRSVLAWPPWCCANELCLTLDHLLHGRSVAVYGIGSKHPFLQHVLHAAQLQRLPRFVLDGAQIAAAAGAASGIVDERGQYVIPSYSAGGAAGEHIVSLRAAYRVLDELTKCLEQTTLLPHRTLARSEPSHVGATAADAGGPVVVEEEEEEEEEKVDLPLWRKRQRRRRRLERLHSQLVAALQIPSSSSSSSSDTSASDDDEDDDEHKREGEEEVTFPRSASLSRSPRSHSPSFMLDIMAPTPMKPRETSIPVREVSSAVTAAVASTSVTRASPSPPPPLPLRCDAAPPPSSSSSSSPSLSHDSTPESHKNETMRVAGKVRRRGDHLGHKRKQVGKQEEEEESHSDGSRCHSRSRSCSCARSTSRSSASSSSSSDLPTIVPWSAVYDEIWVPRHSSMLKRAAGDHDSDSSQSDDTSSSSNSNNSSVDECENSMKEGKAVVVKPGKPWRQDRRRGLIRVPIERWVASSGLRCVPCRRAIIVTSRSAKSSSHANRRLTNRHRHHHHHYHDSSSSDQQGKGVAALRHPSRRIRYGVGPSLLSLPLRMPRTTKTTTTTTTSTSTTGNHLEVIDVDGEEMVAEMREKNKESETDPIKRRGEGESEDAARDSRARKEERRAAMLATSFEPMLGAANFSFPFPVSPPTSSSSSSPLLPLFNGDVVRAGERRVAQFCLVRPPRVEISAAPVSSPPPSTAAAATTTTTTTTMGYPVKDIITSHSDLMAALRDVRLRAGRHRRRCVKWHVPPSTTLHRLLQDESSESEDGEEGLTSTSTRPAAAPADEWRLSGGQTKGGRVKNAQLIIATNNNNDSNNKKNNNNDNNNTPLPIPSKRREKRARGTQGGEIKLSKRPSSASFTERAQTLPGVVPPATLADVQRAAGEDDDVPPALLVIHRVDLLDVDLLTAVMSLCGRYSHPLALSSSSSSSSPPCRTHPLSPIGIRHSSATTQGYGEPSSLHPTTTERSRRRLQLLVSFDHPGWPQSAAYAALSSAGFSSLPFSASSGTTAREGGGVRILRGAATAATAARPPSSSSSFASGAAVPFAFVHLTTSLWPRREERRLQPTPLELVTQYEAVAAAGGGGGGASRAAATIAGDSRRRLPLTDTLRRVLWSLPLSFAALLRHLIAAQEEAGEGKFISVFLLLEILEQRGGTLISQGRWRAVQREMTSNRLAVYDPAEHALMIPQPQKLRKVLEEVTQEREQLQQEQQQQQK